MLSSLKRCSRLFAYELSLEKEDDLQDLDFKKRVITELFTKLQIVHSFEELKKNKGGYNFVIDKSCKIDVIMHNDGGYDVYEITSLMRPNRSYYEQLACKIYALDKIVNVKNIHVIHPLTFYGKCTSMYDCITISNKTQKIKNIIKKEKTHIQMVLRPDLKPTTTINTLGYRCLKPNKCPLLKQCWDIKASSVINIFGMSAQKKISFLQHQILSIKDMDDKELNDFQLIQKRHLSSDYIDKDAVRRLLPQTKDVFFLDFECFVPIFPVYEHMRSFEPVAFAYSLHHCKNGELNHYEYFGNILEQDVYKEIALSLCRLIDTNTPIIVYDDSMEKRVLRSIALHMPEKKDILDKISTQIFDISEIFKNFHCYMHKSMGKMSLKSISRAFKIEVYENLSVKKGSDSIQEYKRFLYTNSSKEARINIMLYCASDTLALVQIYQRLLAWIS